MNVVIVESPAKAKTINGYLGGDYEVLASFGHVRDLPAKDGSVDPEQDFAMLWEVDDKAAKRLSEIVRSRQRPPTRSSWRPTPIARARRSPGTCSRCCAPGSVLKDKPIERVVFNAITKSAVRDAMNNPRDIDQALVDAYLARRALDYLVGFNLSRCSGASCPGARSAGRVQSVALRLVCAREARDRGVQGARILVAGGASAHARRCGALRGASRRRRRQEDHPARHRHGRGGRGLQGRARNSARFGRHRSRPSPSSATRSPPFRTSTLQQDASRKLGLSPARTMQVAQKLYEGVQIKGETTGLITYMRTDGIDMAPEAITGPVRQVIEAIGTATRYLPQVHRANTRSRPRTPRKPMRRSGRPTSRACRRDVASYPRCPSSCGSTS